MKRLAAVECRTGRRYLGRLPHGGDLIRSIEDFCKDRGIRAGSFFLIGAVSSAVIGAYDQEKKTYNKIEMNEPLEIVACSGNISIKDGAPFVHGHIVLGDEQGKTCGGHLFSDTVVFAGEIEILESEEPVLVRTYDEITGLMLWDI